MKGVFKCAKEDDERRSRSVKSSSLGMPQCNPKKYSRRLKRLSLGMPPCIPFFINNHQFALLHAIFLSLHMLCAMLGASCSLLFSFAWFSLHLLLVISCETLESLIGRETRSTFAYNAHSFHFYLFECSFFF